MTTANHFRHCAGPCDQGHKLCPCPEACDADGYPDGKFDPTCAAAWIIAIISALGFWAAIAAFALALRN
jgi:hypothetical protein